MYSYIIFQSITQLESLKKTSSQIHQQYLTLQQEFISYKEKAPEVIVNASAAESKNIEVGKIINESAKQIDGDISIFYKSLTTDESVLVNEHKQYYMASLYKVILTLYILDQVESGKLKLSQKTPDSTITVQKALEKIITESNNEYAQSLAKKYGWDEIEQSMKKKLGIEFRFDKNLDTDVKNMGILFEEISLSLKVPRNETTYLLDLLKDQTRTSKLPKYLPKGIYSHNKTGEFEDYSHDAGIFYTPKGNYILIFMSKSPVPGNTNEIMAKMSKGIYDALNSSR